MSAEERIKRARDAFAIASRRPDYESHRDANDNLMRALWDASADLISAVDERDALRKRVAELEKRLDDILKGAWRTEEE